MILEIQSGELLKNKTYNPNTDSPVNLIDLRLTNFDNWGKEN